MTKLPTVDEQRDEFERHEKMLEEYFTWASEALSGVPDAATRERLLNAFEHVKLAVSMLHNMRIQIQGLRWQMEVQALQIDSFRCVVESIQEELVEKKIIDDPSRFDVAVPQNLRSMTANEKRKWAEEAAATILHGKTNKPSK